MRMEAEADAKEQDDDSDEVDIGQLKKKSKYNVDDITMGLDKQMKLSKKSKQNENIEMDLGTKKIVKGSKMSALRQKRKFVKSRS